MVIRECWLTLSDDRRRGPLRNRRGLLSQSRARSPNSYRQAIRNQDDREFKMQKSEGKKNAKECILGGFCFLFVDFSPLVLITKWQDWQAGWQLINRKQKGMTKSQTDTKPLTAT